MPLRLTAFLFATFFVAYGLLLYVNYNLPVFQQMAAYWFYQPVEVASERYGYFGCLVDTSTDRTIYDRNSENGVSLRYKFSLNDKVYKTTTRSYLGKNYSCGKRINTIYYFPFFPSWTVDDNGWPDSPFIERFWKTTSLILALLLAYVGLLLFLNQNKFAFIAEIKKHQHKVKIFAALCLPLVLTLLFLVLPFDDWLSDLGRYVDRSWRASIFVPVFLFIYGPSAWLLWRSSRQKWQKKVVFIPVLIFGIFWGTRLFEAFLSKLFL